MSLQRPTIVYIVKGEPFKDGFSKYADKKYRQFQTSFREIVERFKDENIDVYFSQIHDITEDGNFLRLYVLGPKTDSKGTLFFATTPVPRSYRPNLVVNRVKDTLYKSPTYNALKNRNIPILNTRHIAELGDKIKSLDKLRSYLPPTAILSSSNLRLRQKTAQDFINEHGKTVVKPYRSNGGRGILIVESATDPRLDDIVGGTDDYVLQQYKETDGGVPGFIKGRHDVRLYVIAGMLVAGLTRQPKAGSFLSNTSQGGSSSLHTISEIPTDLLRLAEQITSTLELPKLSFISLDFFFSNDEWYLIEANDQPGLPALYQNEDVSSSIQNALVITCKEALL